MRIAILLLAAAVFGAAWLLDTSAVLQLAFFGLFGSRYGWLVLAAIVVLIVFVVIRRKRSAKKPRRRAAAKQGRKPAQRPSPAKPRSGAGRRPKKAAPAKR